MSIEWLRDLVICIFGLGTTIAVLFIGVLIFLIYRKVSPILDSVKATTETVENISSSVAEEVYRPLSHLAAFVQGIRQAVNLFGKFSRDKERSYK
ncbi:MAG: hypothetical protein CL874_00520 [Dehalococcoidales bacterium]|jgi:cell shape-determining protein MreC|nr:hypothetical protein [Dehalococcoidales bacterium]MDP6449099.1 hypothetical protein [Dehalococcoidales bacterium]MDP6577469.1 hypothetical protein [Dehalococcoidales bacterium]|tara:strand:- start:450 stop:734 length:285 start_codon:yes stop_codon:yes gene_type:complete